MVPSRGSLYTLFMRLMAVARYRLIVQLTVAFLCLWIGGGFLVYFLETGPNPKMVHPTDGIYALLVTMMTSGDSAVTPHTGAGRIVVGMVLLLSKLLTAVLIALTAALLIEGKVKEEMGLVMHKLEKHIVIVGWNLKGNQIVAALERELDIQKTPVVIMADSDQKPTDNPLVRFTKAGCPIRGIALERAALSKAATIILLANYAEREHADALTAVSCLMARSVNPAARIIAELLDPSQRVYLESAGANSIVGIGEVGGLLLAESAVGKQEAKQLLAAVAPK
jgi:voltage-gated potassium channel